MKHLLLLALLAPAVLLHAQSNPEAVIDRSQQTPPPPTPGNNPTNPAALGSENQDIGTQRVAQTRRLPFKLFVAYDSQFYYTSNAFLTPSSPIDAFIFANSLSARVETKSWTVGQVLFTPSAGLSVQRNDYDLGRSSANRTLLKTLNFDAYSLPLSLRARFGDNWEAAFTLNAVTLYGLEPDYHRIYSALTPELTVRKLIGLTPSHILGFSTGLSYSKTDTSDYGTPAGFAAFSGDRADKFEYTATAAYYYLKSKWVFSPYVQAAYDDYLHYQETSVGTARDVTRRDLILSFGASVSYTFNAYVTARVFVSRDWRDSNQDGPVDNYTYNSANGGIGATLSASF